MRRASQEYLGETRAGQMEQVLAQPPRCRATRESDRLRRAVDLRELVNDRYQLDGVPQLKTRTLRSLIDDPESEQAGQAARSA